MIREPNIRMKFSIKFQTLLQFSHPFSTPYHPQTIGNLERNRCLNEYIRQFIDESQADWDEWLPYYVLCYNTTPHTDFPYTPYELVFGKTATLPNYTKNPSQLEPIYNHYQYFRELKYKLQVTAIRTKALIDKTKIKKNLCQQNEANPINIKINDTVLIENHNRNKLDKVYKGPFIDKKIDYTNVTKVDGKTNAHHIVHKK